MRSDCVRDMNLNVSVCMATYNGGKYLEDQLNSILDQLMPGDELIVSDDGSTDNTIDIINLYADKIKLVSTEKRGGVVENFQKCLQNATNEIIVLSDQDDVWLEGRLAEIRKNFPKYDLIILDGYVVDGDLKSKNTTIFEYVNHTSGFVNNLIKPSYVGCCMAFSKKILEVALPFPEKIKWHDWYISLIAELLYRCKSEKYKGMLFRRHGWNASNTGLQSQATFYAKIQTRVWMLRAIIIAVMRKYKKNNGI